MEPRTIAIGLIAVIAAFAAAFGISSAGGGEKTATAGPGTKAQTIKAPTTAAVTGVEVGGTIPALKAEKKKAKPKKQSSSNSNASTPSTNNTTAQPETTAPSTQNTTPAPQNNTPAPKPQTPKPQPKPQQPISGGGEDG
jgi:FtsZ-interacting cell division protein ZipA